MQTIKLEDFTGTVLRPYDFPRYDRCDVKLLQVLDRMSRALGKRPILTSTFRTYEENKAAKGESNSRHLTGEAVDALWAGIHPKFVVDEAEKLTALIGGIGLIYPSGAVHLETGPGRKRWGQINKDNKHTLQEVLALFGQAPANEVKVATESLPAGQKPGMFEAGQGTIASLLVLAVAIAFIWIVLS